MDSIYEWTVFMNGHNSLTNHTPHIRMEGSGVCVCIELF